MFDPRFLYNTYKILVGLLPVFGYLFSRVKMNGWKWLILTELGIGGSIYTYLQFGNADLVLIKFYGIFIMVYLPLLTLKLGHEYFSQALSITFLLSYLLTEYWEIPTFVCGMLGIFEKTYHGFVNQLYLVADTIILFKVSKLKLDHTNLLYFITPLALSTLVLISFNHIRYVGTIQYVSRLICMVFLGSVFLFGGKPVEAT